VQVQVQVRVQVEGSKELSSWPPYLKRNCCSTLVARQTRSGPLFRLSHRRHQRQLVRQREQQEQLEQVRGWSRQNLMEQEWVPMLEQQVRVRVPSLGLQQC